VRGGAERCGIDHHTDAVRGFFDRQAGTWSAQYDSGLIADRLERFLTVLRQVVPPGGSVLDLGCGSGDITLAAVAEGWRLTGCDLSPRMIDVASTRPGADSASWVKLPAVGRLPFADSSFNAVYSSSVLEYVRDPAAHLAEIFRVLMPGGSYLATVPDMRHPDRRAEIRRRRVAAWPPAMALLRLTRWGPRYEYLRASINRWEIQRWLEGLRAAGLSPDPVSACEHPLAFLTARKSK
jgi:ubiquinone/menaquinone biosynthesis C-methylase UbiE